jgi:septum formation inhibitor MinC
MTRQKFLSEWFKDCEGNIEIRILPDGKQGFFSLDDFQGINAFASQHSKTNIYFGLATRNGHGGTKADIINIPGAWTEIDFKTIPIDKADKLLKECPLQPTFIIQSGGGYHVYWLFREPTDNISIVEVINRQLAQFFESDPVHNADRILRLPDTFNYKYSPKRPVKVKIYNQNNQYNESDFEEHLPPLKNVGADGKTNNPPGWEDELVKGVDDGNRHDAMKRLMGRYIKKGLSDKEILPVVEAIDARNTPPLAKEENLLKFIQSVRRTDEQNHAGSKNYEPSSSPSMADLKVYMDMAIRSGQVFKANDICIGLGAYQRGHKNAIYTYLSRLVEKGVLKKDKYIYGGFIKPLETLAYNLGSNIQEGKLFKVKLPLDLHNLLEIEHNQLAAISGRYDAGKSAFLYHTIALNYQYYRIVHFSSPEWDADNIKKRMDELKIPRPHPNITCYPMEPSYEDLIPKDECIVLVDYIRSTTDPFELDRQFHRIFDNLNTSVCFVAIQKTPGVDRPVGGQFAVHAPHHVVLLDKIKEDYICKIFKSKNEKDLEGVFRTFKFGGGRKLIPIMEDWKKGDIKWANVG